MPNFPKFTGTISPPNPTFFNQPERDFVKQINDEILEYVIDHKILYFAVDPEKTNWHPIYKEAINKVYYAPIKVQTFVHYEDTDTKTTKYGTDRISKITVYFHKKRLNEDQNLNVKEGDIIFYGKDLYEIYKISEDEEVLGNINFKMSIVAYCGLCRQNLNFNTKI